MSLQSKAFDHDDELASLLRDIKESPSHPIRAEVDRLVAGLNLKPFITESDTLRNEDKQNQPEDKETVRNEGEKDLKATEEAPKVTATTPKEAPSKSDRRLDVPLVTTNIRRMSLDLIQRPTMDILHQRASSLSKPALTSTSTVHVLSKPDIVKRPSVSEKRDQKNIPIKSMLKDARRRFSFMAKKDEKSPLLDKLDERLRKAQSPPSEASTPTEKKSRRVSLVIENLPMYIKQQLDAKTPEESPSPILVKRAPRTVPTSRVQNLLANSQSFYARDAESPKSNRESLATYEHEDHNLSDYDKEYILPTLMSRIYENGDPILNGIEELSEDADFININDSYEEVEDEEDEDEEDTYLFRN